MKIEPFEVRLRRRGLTEAEFDELMAKPVAEMTDREKRLHCEMLREARVMPDPQLAGTEFDPGPPPGLGSLKLIYDRRSEARQPRAERE